jgi:hypothetical protein
VSKRTTAQTTAEGLARRTTRRTFLGRTATAGLTFFAALATQATMPTMSAAVSCCCSFPCGQACNTYYSTACGPSGRCSGTTCYNNTTHWAGVPGAESPNCWYDACGCLCCDCWCPVPSGLSPSCQNGLGDFECGCSAYLGHSPQGRGQTPSGATPLSA